MADGQGAASMRSNAAVKRRTIRVACLMVMQQDEDLLLRPWILYHGYLFGFENLHVYTNGSPSNAEEIILKEFSSVGMNVETIDVVAERVDDFRSNDIFDVLVSVESGEFVAIRGGSGIDCQRSQILDELLRIWEGGRPCRTDYSLDSWPGHLDLFRYVEHTKTIDIVKAYPPIADVSGTFEYNPTSILCIRVRPSPSGQRFDCLIRTQCLVRILEALMDFRETRPAWEAKHLTKIPDSSLEIDLDEAPFRARDYLAANADLESMSGDLFGHFVHAGYEEGRRLNASRAGIEEVVERLAKIRAKKRDGRAGYQVLAQNLAALGRADEAEGIFHRAIEEFGESATLVGSYALVAMYRDAYDEAAIRWDRYRALFPQNPDGYHYGAMVANKNGNAANFERIVLAGLEKFPRHVGLLAQHIDMLVERRDWPLVKKMWEQLVQIAPNNREVKARAGSVNFHIRSWQMERLEEDPVDVMDGPVIVGMSQSETAEALAFLGIDDTRKMREFFLNFESLGCTCEFGLVQRRYGAEPIGLLRWNSISSTNLIQALESKFLGFDDPDNIVLLKPGREYVVRDLKYSTAMHTFIYDDEVNPNKFLDQQIKRTTFLRKKLISDLNEGEKIFVHACTSSLSADKLEALRRAFLSYGNGRLLCVLVADTPSQIGRVEEAGDGLLVGYIERTGRGPDGNWNIAFDNWLSLCSGAYNYWKRADSRALA